METTIATLTTKQAYDKGWASSLTDSDWDEAVHRFAKRYCTHPVIQMCDLEHAWADGWSDRVIGHKEGHALRCTTPDPMVGHDACDFEE